MESLKASGFAPVNGLNMYYEVYGEGDIPLVLIHGGGSTIESSFGNLLPLLPGYIIAVELQAHGRTSDRNAPESFRQDADDVAGLLSYLKIAKANIFGFSNGGSTAMQLAIRHPNVVNKIVVASGVYRRDGFIPGFFDGFEHVTLAHMPPALQQAFLKVNPDKNALRVMFERDVERMKTFADWPDEDVASIKSPALFMVAQLDVITIEHTQKMAKLVKGAQLVVLPGTHGGFIGEVGTAKPGSQLPQVTAMLVQEFLSE